jgi:hypothetical protein
MRICLSTLRRGEGHFGFWVRRIRRRREARRVGYLIWSNGGRWLFAMDCDAWDLWSVQAILITGVVWDVIE